MVSRAGFTRHGCVKKIEGGIAMGQVVVITGCADGMGRHVAKMLAAAGHSVAGFDVDSKGITSLVKELKEIGGDHLLKVIDITDRPAIRKFSDQVLAYYGHVDTVLSNVGIGFFSPFEEVNLEKALKCLEINVIGAAAIFQAFIPIDAETAIRQAHRHVVAGRAHSFPVRINIFREQICYYRDGAIAQVRSGPLWYTGSTD